MNNFTLRKTTGVSRLFNERTLILATCPRRNTSSDSRRPCAQSKLLPPPPERNGMERTRSMPPASTGKKGAERRTMKKIVSETAEHPFTQSRVTIGARHNEICAVFE
jgi:hypothetical protein